MFKYLLSLLQRVGRKLQKPCESLVFYDMVFPCLKAFHSVVVQSAPKDLI